MLRLSHILSPASRSSSNPDTDSTAPSPADTSCPRALIGRIPASSPLHLALAHQLGDERREKYGKATDYGVDDLTIPREVIPPEQNRQLEESRNTLIIASERSCWHEALVKENDEWIRDYGAVPEISDALQRIEVKCCSSPKDALILLTLLHASADEHLHTGAEDASSIAGGVPSLVIAWDLFGLFLEHEEQDGASESEEVENGETTRQREPRIRADCAIHEYLSLLSMLRQAIDQITPPKTPREPRLVVLEPEITATSELALPQTGVSNAATGPGGSGRQERRLSAVRALEWILAPGYRDAGKEHTVLEIVEVEEDHQEPAQTPPLARQFAIRTVQGPTVVAFEQRQEARASGKPWLDRIATGFRWL
ncbi:hypothetical protein NCC49_002522 [Naganishia albida]|nr:hypothetical protein NCC49_002522 [Naganishia albida]